ncbi:MAG TPA: SDR family oxidoreductase [Actinophytocola sp.]|uniref:SDR family oxidoreductase n=1 Tax=Actinophytocola sp. TaxID=1872138 RepID=UPI002DDDAFDD|nr:SDR family oxidoreductase [Actinophytocola sp.]HEV2779574.1 SDR family oxidoreductase [Actinophytocola sp.]
MIAERVLITGLSGPLGSELADRLGDPVDHLGDVELVATFSSRRSRESFLRTMDPRLCRAMRAVVCDLADDASVALLASALRATERTVVVHAAAGPTIANVVRLARMTSRHTHLISVSTAERLVRPDCAGLELSTFSCGLLVGHSRTGAISRFTEFYRLPRLLNTGRMPAIPASPSGRLDVVPVDWVAGELFGRLVAACRSGEPCDVVASAGDRAPRVRDVLAAIVATLNRRRVAEGRPTLPDVALLGMRPRDIPELPPRGTSSPAPSASTFLDPVVSFWLDREGQSQPCSWAVRNASARLLTPSLLTAAAR